MEKVFVVDGKNTSYSQLAKLHKEGYKLICADCNAELSVALNLDEAKQKGTVPGIYCPKNGSHVYIHIYTPDVRARIWDKIKKQTEEE